MKPTVIRIGLLIFMLLYAVSPVDAVPGPIDDVIVLLAGSIATVFIGKKRDDK